MQSSVATRPPVQQMLSGASASRFRVNASPDPGGFDLVLPPLSTGGCLGLPRPVLRTALPSTRPADSAVVNGGRRGAVR